MRIRWTWRARLVLIVLAAAGATWSVANAQQFLSTIGAPPPPDVPPKGAWGEVIMANSKWIVIQNQERQQFPIRVDASHIKQFLARWPTNVGALTPNSVVEAIGPDLGNNTVETEYVDVFEGSDQSLVTPTYKSILPNNQIVTTIDPTSYRFMNPWDMAGQAYLHGWAYPVGPGQNGIPTRLHVVGNAFGKDPLQLRILGQNVATILPPEASPGLKLFQVTVGDASYARKGDFVFLTPVRVNVDSLVLNQLVLYKNIPRSRFAN
jgi:hypothetical protein